jgi:hypothetical protein
MPERETLIRAQEDAREGKSPSTQAGEFVREEIHHVREGKHGVRNAKQAIAIGLSEARKAGVKLPPPPNRRSASGKTNSQAAGNSSPKRSRATLGALRKEGKAGATATALSRHATSAARKRSKASRSEAARKAARTRERAV